MASEDSDRTVRNVALLLGLAGLLAFIAALAYVFGGSGRSGGAVLPAAVEAVALDAEAAARGDPAALDRLATASETLRAAAPLPEPQALILKRMQANTAVVLRARVALTDAGAAADDARSLVPKLIAEARALAQGFDGRAAEAAARPLDRLEVLAERIEIDLTALARDAASADQAGQRLAEATDYLGLVVRGLQGSDTGLGLPRVTGTGAAHLERLSALYGDLAATVRHAVNAAPSLPTAQAASRELASDARTLAGSAAVASLDSRARPGWPFALGMLPLVPLVLVFLQLASLRREADRHRESAEAQRSEGDRNQQAILRLLDELSSLADGDLTVQATVTEDITGAIADSINYAVDALRGLVTTINQSAIQVDGAARQTRRSPSTLPRRVVRNRSRLPRRPNRSGAMAARPRRFRETPSAPRTSPAIQSTWRTRPGTPYGAPSMA